MRAMIRIGGTAKVVTLILVIVVVSALWVIRIVAMVITTIRNRFIPSGITFKGIITRSAIANLVYEWIISPVV